MSHVFLDTNVCVYMFDDFEVVKQSAARSLFADRGLRKVISTQVLQESFNVMTRTLAQPLTHQLAEQAIHELSALPVVSSDRTLVHRAVRTVQESKISIWDALIIEAAARADCDVLFTEDLNAGQVIRGVEVVNPFA